MIDRMEASAQVGEYAAVCAFAETIGAITPSHDMIVMPTETLTPALFFSQQYPFASYSLKDMEDMLTDNRNMTVWAMDDVLLHGKIHARCMAVFVSIRNKPLTSRLRTLFLVSESAMRLVCSSLLDMEGASVCLIDDSGKIFCCLGAPLPDESVFTQTERNPAQVLTEKNMEGKDYYLSFLTSATSSWTLGLAVPESSLTRDLVHQQHVATWIMLAFLLAGSLSAFLLTWHNYRPIGRLLQSAFPHRSVTARDDEMTVIADEVERMHAQSQRMRQRLSEQQQLSLHGLCGDLLHGTVSGKDICQQAADCGVSLEGSFYVATLFIQGKQPDLPEHTSLQNCIQSFLTDCAQVLVYFHDTDIHRVTMILTTEEDAPETVFIPLRDQMESRFPVSIAMGISAFCPSSAGIADAYQQACQALDLRLVRGEHCVNLYSEHEMNNALQYYPSQELERLQWHLLQLDADNTTKVIDGLIALIRDEQMSIAGAHMLCYDIINTIIRGFRSLSVDHGPVLSEKHMEELVAFHTIDELTALLHAVVRDTCTSIQAAQSGSGDTRAGAMTKFIEEHFQDADFSLQMMADAFQLSQSNLSHFFKSRTGRTIAEYTQDVRFRESCRLLRETDLPIQDVCVQVGMPNLSSFIRRFKQIYGITPGSYRNNARNAYAETGKGENASAGE